MRPKVTYRDRKLKLATFGIKPPKIFGIDPPPEHPDPDVASCMALWRAKYQQFSNESTNPSNQSIKATLEALTKIKPAELDCARRYLDRATRTHLKRAALVDCRNRHADLARIPAEWLALERVDIERGKFVARPDLPKLAALALKNFPQDTGGAPKISGLDHLIAIEIIGHWKRLYPTKPAKLTKAGSNDFMDWVVKMFGGVGRKLSWHSVARILSKAMKETKRHA